MDIVLTAVRTLHLLVAAAWVGSVLFVTGIVLPLARSGGLNAKPLEYVGSQLKTLSRGSSLVLLLSGGHIAQALYTAETLTSSTPGHLVLGMVALWFVLTGLVEVGTSKLMDGASNKKVRTPAENARPFMLAASLVGVCLLVDAGLISAGF